MGWRGQDGRRVVVDKSKEELEMVVEITHTLRLALWEISVVLARFRGLCG
jgi:hypothetical protein